MNIYGLKHYCCEDFSNIEGYKEALENPNVEYHCHHRLEIQGDKILSVKELIDLGLYYNRPASELIILTKQEHLELHNKAYKGKRLSEDVRKKISEANKGKLLSEETKKKLSEAHKGKSSWNKGKCLSEEHKKKISKAWDYDKHFTTETKEKISEACKGEKNGFYGKKHSEEAKEKMRNAKRKYFENGGVSSMKGKHLSEEAKKLHSEQMKGKHWFNNGEICVRAKECPEGFVPGRLRRK